MARPISPRDRRRPVRESGQPTGFRRHDRLRASRATRSAGLACSDPTTFCRLDELDPEVIGQRLGPRLACRVVEPDQWCRRYVPDRVPRDTMVRRLDPTGAELAPHGARGRRAPLPVQRLRTRVAPRHQRGEQSIPIDVLKGAGRPAT